jgi:hypothetical protein
MDGWVGGWMAGKAGLRIAYSNQKYKFCHETLGSFETRTLLPWAWSYQQKFSDLRNFLKNSENFEPADFVRKVRKLSIWCNGLVSLLDV